ncbi:MAG: PPOX class F420-dependent oxidoreductase [Actinomycetota bacterium]|nr:PPOX class F420-dependent oxidoreductase [Actinomycetota bacterium]
MVKIATADRVDRLQLLEFIRSRHRCMLSTRRVDGGDQLSPVTAGVDDQGRIVIASYPQRAKVRNLRRNSAASACFVSDEWNGPWVQVSGTSEILDLPEALDAFVAYYRGIAGEHPDWDEYRQAMVRQGKCLIRLTIEHWGPIATGGFPPEDAPRR